MPETTCDQQFAGSTRLRTAVQLSRITVGFELHRIQAINHQVPLFLSHAPEKAPPAVEAIAPLCANYVNHLSTSSAAICFCYVGNMAPYCNSAEVKFLSEPSRTCIETRPVSLDVHVFPEREDRNGYHGRSPVVVGTKLASCMSTVRNEQNPAVLSMIRALQL